MKNTMKALVLQNFGDTKFVNTELAIPQPERGEVLVQVKASGVNPIDYKIREGLAPYAMPTLPAVIGTDMAGTVVAVGEDVQNFQIGDDVYGLAGGVRGLQGSLAQYMAVDARLIAHKPKNLTMREAAAVPLTFLTAWEGLVDNAKVQADHRVLVQGGSGGVGSMAIQIAKAFGAKVWATGSAQNQELITSLGAQEIDYNQFTAHQILDEYTAGEGFDIVYDTVGANVLKDSLGMSKYYGHITSCAAFSEQNLAASSLRCVTLSGVFVLLPMLTGLDRARHGAILAQATQLIEQNKIRPVVDARSFSMEQAIEAQNAVKDGSASIKVVVDIDHFD